MSWQEQVSHPTPFFSWGADYRLRQEYLRDVFDFTDDDRVVNPGGHKDNRNVIRNRARLWTKFGPFLGTGSTEVPSGLSFYARFLYGPRYYLDAEFGRHYPNPQWDEVVFDNLYAEWLRIGGGPVSLRIGRQDFLDFGRGFVIMDGTPLDASRTAYNDAIRATIHFDSIKSTLDLFAADNKGEQDDRLRPLSYDHLAVNEYDTHALGAYFKYKQIKDTEIDFYYIYAHEKPIDEVMPFSTTRYDARFVKELIHTVGTMVQGKVGKNWDYYAELAGQWGEHGKQSRRASAFSSDLGYTFDAPMKPRIHGGYEFMSGDDPHTGRYEGWDPVLARWPRWTELLGYRSAKEYGRPYYFTNNQRFVVGAGVKPAKGLTVSFDYSYLRVDEHEPGSPGHCRGNLFLGVISYDISENLTSRIWAEYFKPGSYFAGDHDPALFLQWQMILTFPAPSKKKGG